MKLFGLVVLVLAVFAMLMGGASASPKGGGSALKKGAKAIPPPPEPPKEDETGLLASINPNLPCCCEVMSRALSDDLPKILGMSDRRAALQFGPDDLLDCNPDIKFDDTGESTTKDSERASCAKPAKGK